MGAGRKDMAKRFAFLCTAIGMGIMALSGMGLWLFAPALMGIFTADAAVIALGARVLRIEAFAEPMFGVVGVWSAMCCELCIRGLLFLVRLARGKWQEKGALS